MYSELIYTRCRQGIDILRGGRPVLSDGFKVYSCSGDIIDGDIVDLPLLFNMAQCKQTYSDPNFMDEVYVFAAPDKGRNILVNFHPIHFDKDAKGDYSHRPGNFINQIFIGGFEEIYPYELFGSESVWDAKIRGEAFYYENEPQPLPCRSEFDEAVGSIVIDDIQRFVSDGRRDTVKVAVAFIIEQFGLPPENRKYLVIRDESASCLELWVAAIESAFSPRMASGLPFATRMDKFVNTNRYTINQNGLYQAQMNLQDPKQKQRLRAMIVGIDERDKANASTVRHLPNAPYIILDGRSREIDYAADTSSSYYSLATSYSGQHIRFCREFLQMLDIKQPTVDILKLYDAYTVLDSGFANSSVREIAASLAVLETQKMFSCAYLNQLYGMVKEALPCYLKEDLLSAFTILNWLKKTAPTAGDAQASIEFNSIVSKVFANCVYGDPLGKGTTEFWIGICNSNFADVAADYLVSSETFESYRGNIEKYDVAAWIAFCQVYLPCAKRADVYTVDGIYEAVRNGINACIQSDETEKALEICGMIRRIDSQIFRDLLIRLSCETDNVRAKHYMCLLLRSDTGLVATDHAAIDFAHFMQKQGQELLGYYVMEYRAEIMKQPSEMENYLDALIRDPAFRSSNLSSVYVILDSKLQLYDKSSTRIALRLQEMRKGKEVYPVSAHISALNALSGKRNRHSMIDEFKSYARQRFPSIADEEYAGKLVRAFLSCKLNEGDFDAIVGILVSSRLYLRTLSREVIETTTNRNSYAWNVLINVLSARQDAESIAILSDECMAARKSEKQIDQLLKMLDSRKAQVYFSEVAENVRQRKEAEATKSGLGRLFGLGRKKK